MGERVLSLNQLPTQERVNALRELAVDSFTLLRTHAYSNGLVPASLGRFDDHHFIDNSWVKDTARAVQFVLDPDFQYAFPDLQTEAQSFYLKTVNGLLAVQLQPEQQERFKTRPSARDINGYGTVDDRDAPAIKFHGPTGQIIRDWGHNQPDNWGIMLLEIGKGIEAGLPILQQEENPGAGLALSGITSYLVNLRVERLICRSIWEHRKGWSPSSTRWISWGGLDQMGSVWDSLEEDSKNKGYVLPVSRKELTMAAKNLQRMASEREGDYTDSEGHHFGSDLASLVAVNDINLPQGERNRIIEKVSTGSIQDGLPVSLENGLGFYRYLGDPWRRSKTEAEWTMGKAIMARVFFREALDLMQSNPAAANRYISQGLDRMHTLINMQQIYGYIPELFQHNSAEDIYKPNNNDLAWTRSYIIEAASSGIRALELARAA